MIPLAALRPVLDGGWPAGARWLGEEEIAGAHGVALEQPLGTRIAFRLRRCEGRRLQASVALAVANRPLSGACARIGYKVSGAPTRWLWSRWISPWGRRRTPVEVPLPAMSDPLDLVLTVTGPGSGRLLWIEPALIRVDGATPASVAGPRPVPAGPRTAITRPELTIEHTEHGSAPLFSILVPVHDPDPVFLSEAIDSVHEQTFGDWELCLCDDGSHDPRVLGLLKRATRDRRVCLTRMEGVGTAAATNAALELASGEYIALLDHDDVLAPDALEAMASAIAAAPESDFLYSDEVVTEGDGLGWPYLKPDYSPDLLRSIMYTCHLSVFRRSHVVALAGLRTEMDGSQDHDLALRVAERATRIVHVPRVLYRWRGHSGSAATNPLQKPHAFPAGRRAVAEHLRRIGVQADVTYGPAPGRYRVVHSPRDERVALVLPLRTWNETTVAKAREMMAGFEHAVAHQSELVLTGAAATIEACERVLETTHLRLRVVEASGSGFGALANAAAVATDASCLVFLECPVEPLEPSWLELLVGYAGEVGVGAVGAKTLAPDGRVEHLGNVIVDGLPRPVMHGADPAAEGPVVVGQVTANFSAVSGVVATSRSVFEQLGRFDVDLSELALIDYCLRAREADLRVVSVPDALVRRSTNTPPVNDLVELAKFRSHWRSRFPRDPYLNPGFHTYRADYTLRAEIIDRLRALRAAASRQPSASASAPSQQRKVSRERSA